MTEKAQPAQICLDPVSGTYFGRPVQMISDVPSILHVAQWVLPHLLDDNSRHTPKLYAIAEK